MSDFFRTVTLAPLLARTASGSGVASPGFDKVDVIRAALVVTAASGTTPSLTVYLEDTLDGTNWFTVTSFAAATAATSEAKNITGGVFSNKLRARWAITGTTPSFTFSVFVSAR